jgi:cytochrome c-type biogenesis protein CcmH
MMFWALLIGMTVLAALLTLWPLIFRTAIADNASSEIDFYLTQLSEVERDIERGQLPRAEAEAARAEMGRRLIGLEKEKSTLSPLHTDAALRRMALIVGLLVLPLLSALLYSVYGRPTLKDMPLASREDVAPEGDKIGQAIAKIEADIVRNPDNLKAWTVLAPVYMQLGRFKDAVFAYGKILQIGGENATHRAHLAEAKVAVANGTVTDDAKRDFAQALSADPSLSIAEFYLALGVEQAGDDAQAITLYESLLEKVSDRPNWAKVIKGKIAALKNEPVQPEAKPSADADMILGMVSRLAARLESEGGSVEDWVRLIRSYSALAKGEDAAKALAKARTIFAKDEAATSQLQSIAKQTGLSWR